MIKLGTTFSGIGAPEQALKNLNINFSCEWACDIDKFCKQTYLANHECKTWYDDITKIDIENLSDIDLYIFGFPCQSYSSQGLKGGLDDHRGKLIYPSLKILEIKKPDYFIAENVRGLVSHNGGETFKIIKKSFEDLGYRIHYKVLNTKDFGVPQNRPRIYIVGIKNEIEQEFSFETVNIKSRLKDFLDDPFDERSLLSEKSIQYCQNPKFKSDKYVEDPEIARCLRTSGKTYYKIDGVYRHLSTSEQKRLQGFPEGFNIPVSDAQASRQFGNTMTVNVIQSVLKNLLKHD